MTDFTQLTIDIDGWAKLVRSVRPKTTYFESIMGAHRAVHQHLARLEAEEGK